MECLIILQLTDFLDLVDNSDFMRLLTANDTGTELTFFAPTNAAFDDLEATLNVDLNNLAGHHIVDGTLKESDFAFDMRFMTASNTTLHSTTVVYADRTLMFNPGYSSNHPSNLIRYTTVSSLHYTLIKVSCSFKLLPTHRYHLLVGHALQILMPALRRDSRFTSSTESLCQECRRLQAY